jgi:hypothetical protein
MAAKLLREGVMQHLRGAGPVLLFVLAIGASTPSRAAVYSYTSSVNPPFQSLGTTIEDLQLPMNDYSWRSADTMLLALGNSAGAIYQPAYVADGSEEDLPELGGVVRHRSFIKILLIVFVCGALIRFLSSPTFLNFIIDGLDPKVW